MEHRHLKLNRSPNQTHPLTLQTWPHPPGAAPSSTCVHKPVTLEPLCSLSCPSPPISCQPASYVDWTLRSVLVSPIPSSLFQLGAGVHHLSPGFQVLYLEVLTFKCFTCLWSCFSPDLSPPASSMVQRAVLTLSFPCLRSIRASLLPKVVVLKMWCLDGQHQHHQGTCQSYKFSGPTIECLLNQTLC